MDAAEFKKRFLPLSRRLYRVAWSLTHNVQDAEDLVQDTYCRLWHKRNQLRAIVNDEAYCVRLLKNLYHDKCRATQHHGVDIGPPDGLQLFASDDVQETMERSEAATALRQIIDQLPDTQREVITRRDLQMSQFNEIAAELGMAEATVRVTLSRARRKLKEQFLKWMSYDNPTNH